MLDHLERLTGVEARQQLERTARCHRRVQGARLAEGVKQRERTERHRVRADVEQLEGDGDVLGQVRVRELGALRLARGARRVQDHRRVVRIPLDHAGRLGSGEHGVELLRLNHDHLGVVRSSPGRLRELVPGEQDAGTRVGHVVGHLTLLEQHVHRHDRGTGAQRAVIADREIGRHSAA